jgi:hypothetical protein
MYRRGFLKAAALALPASRLGLAAQSSGSHQWPPTDDLLELDRLRCPGRFVTAEVPETLDLAERAWWAVNNLTHNVDPQYSFYVYQSIDFGAEEEGPVKSTRTFDITGKNLRALPWMRTMCGRDEFLAIERGMLKAMLDSVRADGLLYFPREGFRPAGTSYPAVNGILALACENHHALSGNQRWLDCSRSLAAGLSSIAIRAEDRAFYPPECTIDANRKWVWNTRGHAILPYVPPDEPYLDQQGLEGAVKWEQAYPLRAFSREYRRNPSPELLELIDRFTHFMLKPGMWENTTSEGYKGYEHGIFSGHFHGNTAALLALLDVAEVRNSAVMCEFVREAYHHALQVGSPMMGWFPGWITPAKYERDPIFGKMSEGDGPSELIQLAVRLSDSGLGDYWDDVDAIVRNQLIEQQFVDVEAMRRAAKNSRAATDVARYAGGFGMGSPTGIRPSMYGCCSANGAMGLYYAWHGITRLDDRVATVNLLLNRVSPWVDIRSYLPYEGRVELENKSVQTMLVRIPRWTEASEVVASVGGRRTVPPRAGRYLVFDGLGKGDRIRLDFPNPGFTLQQTIAGRALKVSFRGSTVVGIEPGEDDPALLQWTRGNAIPLYQRADFKKTSAPVRSARLFIPERTLPLQ